MIPDIRKAIKFPVGIDKPKIDVTIERSESGNQVLLNRVITFVTNG